ncbi:hypothetical protein M595_3487 [Lyngbya aestuarii BL J]|uniref:Uncharacterized protein n=1 Tax=Lyngbya aestuarii BL J TaxID=1348334 RepID=U7Q985_9CYAN|nr:hypothetical protein M595_6298 [Lyngbya aestuarii BL J]ERT04483.1 hypothetical protein M595_5567 [Lyngbya aestuarii BL J]ERT06597.1 hypothetical protein M595_3487 [Lyngbya aestuarii BL J]
MQQLLENLVWKSSTVSYFKKISLEVAKILNQESRDRKKYLFYFNNNLNFILICYQRYDFNLIKNKFRLKIQ